MHVYVKGAGGWKIYPVLSKDIRVYFILNYKLKWSLFVLDEMKPPFYSLTLYSFLFLFLIGGVCILTTRNVTHADKLNRIRQINCNLKVKWGNDGWELPL